MNNTVNNDKKFDTAQAVGRIDYLDTNGMVAYSNEYADESDFVATVMDENWVGTPMIVVVYRDKDGQTIPLDFANDFAPPPQGFKIVDYAQAQLDLAKQLINEFCVNEYDSEADFSALESVPLAHSSTGDGEHFIDVIADLVAFRLVCKVDGETVVTIQCEDMAGMNERLANLEFDEMICFVENEWQQGAKKGVAATGKKRLEVETPLGTIIVEAKGTLDEYPGVWVSFKPKGSAMDDLVACVEHVTGEDFIQTCSYMEGSDEPAFIQRFDAKD